MNHESHLLHICSHSYISHIHTNTHTYPTYLQDWESKEKAHLSAVFQLGSGMIDIELGILVSEIMRADILQGG